MFTGPIPGQSLTSEPKKYPWQRPPETVDPDQAIRMHLERLANPKIQNDVLFAMEYGVPIKQLTEMILTGAVANGIHTIDISLIINPVIHEYLINMAEDAQIDYLEDFDTTEDDEEEDMRKAVMLLKKSLKKTPQRDRDEGFQMLQQVAEASSQEATPEEQPKGFVQRRMK